MTSLLNLDRFISKHVTRRGESLLKADIVANHQRLTANIEGKSALVIGGAGTIGSNFIKELLYFKPAKVVVVDINENGLTELVRDCRSSSVFTMPNVFITYPVNMGDPIFNRIVEREGPFDIVANFAAHKHVRSEKDVLSIQAMIENNVFRAVSLLDLLAKQQPSHFFCVSTDKAANPVNIMGASKKLMEDVILAYSEKMKITTARFANVAFSNGSLLAGFIERIMKRQPLSTPSDVKRFFVSPEESGQICLLACILGQSGDILFPRLHPETDLVNFADIATDFISYLGMEPAICHTENEARKMADALTSESLTYPLYLSPSSTSGEKLYEEFYTDDEELDWDSFKMLGVIKNAKRRSLTELSDVISAIKAFFEKDVEKKEVVALLSEILPSFHHIEKEKNLDQHM
ncbi:SDR family NAD(P)-dependent oxidoreductase [uncultured Chitinophaga sp.]|uniref:SDR family NAD(P)-dependent oxidoreductase n=1 Tax=uncultured Chitinophaga sp. TaxID=339340 RepID=UPI0025F38309|nr:SDR family NAD(P)-dependent oxidoreductase [uncultured Chitinophaga sp.]